MSFLLKIVEGPNKGAEIALVSGVPVTFGKGEDCDIVLADPTLPPSPVSIEASDVGVTADGEALEPFMVKTVGSTSFQALMKWQLMNYTGLSVARSASLSLLSLWRDGQGLPFPRIPSSGWFWVRVGH